MSNLETASRYAHALFNLTSNNKEVKEQLEDFTILEKLLQKPSRFFHYMISPQIGRAEKENLIKTKLSRKENQKFIHFLLLLLQKDRFYLLPDIVKNYKKSAQNKLGLMDVSLITSVPLNESTKHKIQTSLEKKFHKKPHIQEEVNPDLLGGAILIIGNKMIDSSIKGKLLKLRKYLLNEAV